MSLESATYIGDLVSTNPTSTDPVSQGDDHLRLIKAVLTATFTALSGAVTVSQTQINAACSALAANVLTVPAGTTTDDGGHLSLAGQGTGTPIQFINNGSGLIISNGTTTLGSVDNSGDLSMSGMVNGTLLLQGGNPLLPTGCIIMWAGAITAIPAGWTLCNGLNGTPNLLDRFVIAAGASHGVGGTGGSAIQTVGTTSDGAHAHGGATVDAGYHTHVSAATGWSGATDGQGSHSHGGATAAYTLTINDIPSHSHGLPSGPGVMSNAGSGGEIVGGSNGGLIAFVAQGGGGGHLHGIYVDGFHGHNVALNGDGDHVHGIYTDGWHTHTVTIDVRPYYYALCYIMKL